MPLAAIVAAVLCGSQADGANDGRSPPPRVIVEFESPSLVRAAMGGKLDVRRGPGGKLDPGCPESRRYLGRLDEEHERFRLELARRLPDARVDWELRILFNGAVVATARPDLLAAVPGVARVSRTDTALFRPSLDASLDMIGAPSAWVAAGGDAAAGEGVRIAVIDSGVDPDNPFFRPDGLEMPAGYPLGAAAHASAKLIAARAYFRPGDPVDTALDEPNPRDHIGHGSHCAGIAAGRAGTVFDVNGTPLEIGGVAPAARLMNYKVFYRSESGQDGAFEPELMAAFEDAVADGADVISCSWGGPDNLLETPSAEVYRAAVDAGVVVVFAAGNDGSGPGTIAYPGTLGGVLTVGSFDTGRGFAGRIEIFSAGLLPAGLSVLPALKGTISPSFAEQPLGPLPLAVAAMVGAGGNAEGCEPFILDAFIGSAALIRRGVCPFSEKVRNAWLAGAEAVVVYNDVPGESAVVMGGDPVPIPAVQLGNPEGVQLEQWLLDHPGSEVSVVFHDVYEPYRRPEEERRMSSFSARGPTDRPVLKPELTAPGRSILSADARAKGLEGPWWGVKQGTSMAAPHVAGAAALLRGLHPEAGPRVIASLLVGSARLEHAWEPPVTVMDTGAGQLDLERAVTATAGVLPVALSFGEGPRGTRFERSLNLFDLHGTAGRTISWIHGHMDCEVQEPLSGTWVVPGEVIDVVFDCPPAAEPGEGFGWMLLAGDGPEVAVPYHFRIVPARNRELLLLDMTFDSSPAVASIYEGLASEAGLDYETFQVSAVAGAPSLEYLSRFATVLAFTGDDRAGHRQRLGRQTLDLLSTYARKGGNLIVAGQGPWRGSTHPRIGGLLGGATHPWYPLYDPDSQQVAVLEDYLARSTWDEALPEGTFDLGPWAGGTGNAALVGELVDRFGPGLPAVFGRPVLRMEYGAFAAGGRVGMVFDPYRGYGAYPGMEDLRHRAVMLGFGFEQVGDFGQGTATRRQLFERFSDWVSERIRLSVAVEQFGTHVLVEASTSGATPVEFEFDFGDGSPPLVSGYRKAWYEYGDLGEKSITVLVRAALGAADIRRVTITLVEEQPVAYPDGGSGEPVPPPPLVERSRDCSCLAVGGGRAVGVLGLLAGLLPTSSADSRGASRLD